MDKELCKGTKLNGDPCHLSTRIDGYCTVHFNQMMKKRNEKRLKQIEERTAPWLIQH